ncbi:hypothetical protein C8Q70DRAFT_991352 [Cubamyces menziesii]|nr:hypothetical protein C8Q70DRAFT_991352 [Cubamyces menziesii]
MSLLEHSICTTYFCPVAIAATCWDCFACVIVERNGSSPGLFGKRAERRDGDGAVEEFVMLVSCTGYGGRTIGLNLDPHQDSSNESKSVKVKP